MTSTACRLSIHEASILHKWEDGKKGEMGRESSYSSSASQAASQSASQSLFLSPQGKRRVKGATQLPRSCCCLRKGGCLNFPQRWSPKMCREPPSMSKILIMTMDVKLDVIISSRDGTEYWKLATCFI